MYFFIYYLKMSLKSDIDTLVNNVIDETTDPRDFVLLVKKSSLILTRNLNLRKRDYANIWSLIDAAVIKIREKTHNHPDTAIYENLDLITKGMAGVHSLFKENQKLLRSDFERRVTAMRRKACNNQMLKTMTEQSLKNAVLEETVRQLEKRLEIARQHETELRTHIHDIDKLTAAIEANYWLSQEGPMES